jgi:Ser/Thr protein kinase RdoA (MazF antagonist)
VHHDLDLYLANTVVRDGKYAALLDFEYARAWDPVTDFVKPSVFVFSAYPEAQEAMLQGYQMACPLPAGLKERFGIALGLELVTSIPYFYRVPDRSAYDRYRKLFDEWMEQFRVGLHSIQYSGWGP